MAPDVHHEALKELAARIEPELPAMLDEQEAAVHRELPGLVARIDTVLVRHGIDATNRRFVAMLQGEQIAESRDVNIEFGALCARAGVPLEDVVAGYRLGSRVAWRRTTAHVEALDLPVRVTLRLAEGWLAYADELSSESVEGYEREAAVVRSTRARAQQELVEALLSGRDPAAAAEKAGWPLPAEIVAGVPLSGFSPTTGREGAQGRVDGATVVLLDARADVDQPLALGPAVPPNEAAVSLARARRVAGLAAAGVLDATKPLRWEDHLPDLVVHADPAAGAALAQRLLAPLQALPPARRAMLTETLTAWLDHPGQPQRIGQQLHLHPQTVRYRLARLREHLGDALDNPRDRFALQLALRTTKGRPEAALRHS